MLRRQKTQTVSEASNSFLNSVADQAALADALADVEPHQHLGGHQAVPHGLLGGWETIIRHLGMQPSVFLPTTNREITAF